MSRVPINEYIVKIASRCNLNCDYCYEYNLGDDSWRRNPRVLSIDTAEVLGNRIREHALRHGLPVVFVSFHGGEPLLVGARHLDALASRFRKIADGEFEVVLTMQTNATLLDRDAAEVIAKHDIL